MTKPLLNSNNKTDISPHHSSPGYAISQQKRKRVEEIFRWVKTVAGLRKTRHRGVARVGWMFTFALAAYNLGGGAAP